MEKMLWTALLSVWMLVWKAAVFGATVGSPETTVLQPDMATVPVLNVKLSTAARQLPTRVLDDGGWPEAMGVVLGTVLTFRVVAKRRPI